MIPVITAVSSILGFRRGEQFQFQPTATNSPTSWAASSLPSGVTINATTGLISGSVSVSGVWQISVTATNAAGTSAAVVFVLGISPELAPSAATSSSAAIDIDIDVATRTVTGRQNGGGAAGSFSMFAKARDTILVSIRFRKGETVVDPNCTALKLVAKQYEPENLVVESGAFEKVGTGDTAIYNLLVPLTKDELLAALANVERDAGTFFESLAEIEWTQSITHASTSTVLRTTTQTFTLNIARDLAAN